MSAQQVAIAHPVSITLMPKYGIVTHEDVPPGTVIIWPANGEAPLVLNTEQLAGELAAELFEQKAPSPHPLTAPIPTKYGLGQTAPPNPYKAAFLVKKAQMAEMDAMHKQMFKEMAFGAPLPRECAPEVDFIDSSNPFAKVLDAWQTGKAGWTQGVLTRPSTKGE